jgi:hypothetical protein
VLHEATAIDVVGQTLVVPRFEAGEELPANLRLELDFTQAKVLRLSAFLEFLANCHIGSIKYQVAGIKYEEGTSR